MFNGVTININTDTIFIIYIIVFKVYTFIFSSKMDDIIKNEYIYIFIKMCFILKTNLGVKNSASLFILLRLPLQNGTSASFV